MSRRKYTDQEFADAIKNNYSVASALKYLGLKPAGGSYKLFYSRVIKLNLNISHFTGQGHLKGKNHSWKEKIPLEKILVNDSSYNTNHLKKRLIKEGIIKYQCSRCNIDSWQGEKIVLELDHINGVNIDHRLTNLRLLCPNCHSLTETFRSKKRKNLVV